MSLQMEFVPGMLTAVQTYLVQTYLSSSDHWDMQYTLELQQLQYEVACDS